MCDVLRININSLLGEKLAHWGDPSRCCVCGFSWTPNSFLCSKVTLFPSTHFVASVVLQNCKIYLKHYKFLYLQMSKSHVEQQ